MEMKSVNKQMKAMKNAFEVLHANLSSSCETMGDRGEDRYAVEAYGEDDPEDDVSGGPVESGDGA